MADQKLLELAKYAERSERYEDMAKFMEEFTKDSSSLSAEERNLLSVAFKNVVGARRSSWRVISSLEQKEDNVDERKRCVEDYRGKVESELKDICKKVLGILDQYLESDIQAVSQTEVEAQVFYWKMNGDYHRYLAEVAVDKEKEDAMDNADKGYEQAQKLAAEKLPSTHPIRLGLALNFSVFYYEIKNEPDKACKLAKKAFDDAIAELDQLKEDSYKDSTLIMQLLRDNLTLWTADIQGDDPDDGDN